MRPLLRNLQVLLLCVVVSLLPACRSIAAGDLDALVEEAKGNSGLGLHGGHEDIQPVLDEVIDVSHDELHGRMDAGQNLAAVAVDVGVDPRVVIDALVANARVDVDLALANGVITSAQADAYVRALEAAFIARVHAGE